MDQEQLRVNGILLRIDQTGGKDFLARLAFRSRLFGRTPARASATRDTSRAGSYLFGMDTVLDHPHHTTADLFDVEAAKADLGRIANDYGGRERELRLAVAQRLKTALADYTVERTHRGWFYGRTSRFGDVHAIKGPYSSERVSVRPRERPVPIANQGDSVKT